MVLKAEKEESDSEEEEEKEVVSFSVNQIDELTDISRFMLA
jgi:hypothetical protein